MDSSDVGRAEEGSRRDSLGGLPRELGQDLPERLGARLVRRLGVGLGRGLGASAAGPRRHVAVVSLLSGVPASVVRLVASSVRPRRRHSIWSRGARRAPARYSGSLSRTVGRVETRAASARAAAEDLEQELLGPLLVAADGRVGPRAAPAHVLIMYCNARDCLVRRWFAPNYALAVANYHWQRAKKPPSRLPSVGTFARLERSARTSPDT